MLWAFLAAAGAGLAIGLRFRVTMLLAAGAVLSALTVAAAIHSGWTVSRTLTMLVLLLATQQAAYLVGLVAASRR
jgi:hypothetical protein